MIDDPEYRALLQRLDRLERETPRVRQGTVTAGSPLAVSLGASPTSFDDVRALHGATVDDGAQVAALTFGNDMLVLGGVGPGLGVPLVTSLPSPAFDGQVVDFDTGTDGIVWRFRYDAGSASSYKWQFIGGSPIQDETGAAQATTSTSYVDLAAVGPAIAIPLAGEYVVEISATIENTVANNDFMSYQIGGSAAVDADAITRGGTNRDSVARNKRKTLTAVTLTAKYRVSSGTGTFRERRIAATPIRVG